MGSSREKHQFIVVVGCGRLGSTIANQLSMSGNSVVVIDPDQDAFHNLSVEFSGFTVAGDASELAVLRQARIEHADCLLAVSRHDNINLMVAQVARQVFSVPKVVARVRDPSREAIFQRFGVDTICPTNMVAEAFLQAAQDQAQGGNA